MSEKYVVSIGFSKRKGFNLISRLISLVEGTDFSHTFVSWKCTFIDRRKVYEAVGSGSRKISNHRFKEKALVTDIYQFEVDEEALAKIDRFTHDEAGTPYGYKHLVGIAIMRLCGFVSRLFGLKKKCKNPFKDGNYSQICVESGALILELNGIDIPGDIEDYGLREFHQFVSAHGQKVPQEKIDQINQG
jgi:hypothetical protein